jgi:hypothetical protein
MMGLFWGTQCSVSDATGKYCGQSVKQNCYSRGPATDSPADALAWYAFVLIVSAVITPLPPTCRQMKPMLPWETLFAGLKGSGDGDGQGERRHDLRHTHYILPDL